MSVLHRYCRKFMAHEVEDEKLYMLECPACREIRSELFDYCEGDLGKLMCHPKQHILANLVQKGVFSEMQGQPVCLLVHSVKH